MQIGKNDIAAAVLAGGQSRRMGRDKARLPWGDGSFLTSIVQRAQGAFNSVVLSVREAGAYPDLGVPTIADDEPGAGPLCAVTSALGTMESEWLMAIACDMPFVGRDEWRALTQYVAEDVDVVVPRTPQGLQPLCALYHRSCLAPFRAALREEQLSMHGALNRVRCRVVDFDDSPSADPFLNVNTPEGLAEAQARANRLAGVNA